MSVRVKGRRREGFAMVVVLLTLLALLVLSAPFLLTVSNADRASAQLADRARARVALDAAARHGAARLAASHPSLDRTPSYDSLEEIRVRNDFPAGFLDPEGRVLWDLEVEDLAGRIDPNSAPPQVFANLLGQATRLAAAIDAEATEVGVLDASGLEPDGGFLWIEDELVAYRAVAGTTLLGLVRGLGAGTAGGGAVPCGPDPATAHPVGATVIDQRSVAIATWRLLTGSAPPGDCEPCRRGELRRFGALEDVLLAEDVAMAKSLGRDVLGALERTTSVYGDVRAGQRWQHGTRLLDRVEAGPEGCYLRLADTRWFNPGTTVEITDGDRIEFALVLDAGRDVVRLRDPVANDFEAYETVVRPLARRPVDLNTAPPAVLLALVENVQLRGSTSRITRGKARTLVDVIVASRPFDGFEDFLRRVVLPAAGLDHLPDDAPVVPEAFRAQSSAPGGTLGGFLDEPDAVALYKNALNANDNELSFSTMPFAFTTRDVYALSLRASINARSGIERASLAREEVRVSCPQEPGLTAWSRQEDLDMALRLDREAPGWITGPEVTSRYDAFYGSDPPTRARAHLGPYDTRPSMDPAGPEEGTEHVFASREENPGWAQLAVSRADEEGDRRGRVLHFDDERAQLEGRFLPDRTVEEKVTGLPDWADDEGLLKPLHWEAWIQPRGSAYEGALLDVAGAYFDADRVTLFFEEGELVLRVRSGAPDHKATELVEQAEVRFDYGEAGALPPDTWSHVAVEVRGTRPDQLDLLVDGRHVGRRPGLTYLTRALAGDETEISVESTEGFPDRCVLQIGEELVEAETTGEDSFSAVPDGTGFGGRLARQRMLAVGGQLQPEGILTTDDDHPQGAAVRLYGYSVPFASSVQPGSTALPAAIGRFRVARVRGVTFADGQEQIRDKIKEAFVDSTGTTIAYGLFAQGSRVVGITLRPTGSETDDPDFMQAFDPAGGYALLVQRYRTVTSIATSESVTMGGYEVVSYSGVTQDGLVGLQRNVQLGKAEFLAASNFAVWWEENTIFAGFDPKAANTSLDEQVLVIPISLTVKSASALAQPNGTLSEVAQITRRDDPSQAEWVRYDQIDGSRLVRSEERALWEAGEAALAGNRRGADATYQPQRPPGPGGGGDIGGIGGGRALLPSRAVVRAPRVTQVGGAAAYWSQDAGVPDPDEDVVTRAVRTALQFRGVMGTFPRDHPADALVLPVLQVWEGFDPELRRGLPGRGDAVSLLTDDDTGPAFPNVVHHAHRLGDYYETTWTPGTGRFEAVEGEPIPWQEIQVDPSGPDSLGGLPPGFTSPLAVYVGLEEPTVLGPQTDDPLRWARATEARLVPRLVLFPSGELPRRVDRVVLGGSAHQDDPLPVPDVLIDEAVFLDQDYASGTQGYAGAALLLGADLDVSGHRLELDALNGEPVLLTAGGEVVYKNPEPLPREVGLLRIGEEILACEGFAGSQALLIPDGGRGLLGTTPEVHVAGEPMQYLERWRAGTLASSISAEANLLPIFPSTDGFPEEGLVLVDEELVHYTQRLPQGLWMPRASREPGRSDDEGKGLFRGRFGTSPAGHETGTPVILFPYRYADRFAPTADAPELAYFQFTADQPGGFWLSTFWKADETDLGGPRLGCLVRTDQDVPWDAPPGARDGLRLFHEGMPLGKGNPLGVASDRVEARVFVEYPPGAFDLLSASHEWKRTPRLEVFGLESIGPDLTLARIER